MNRRYMLRAKNYGASFYQCEHQYESIIFACAKFIALRFKYDLVEFEYRK